jgi:drug/metabolite transporter (DMT)-like permease
MVSGKILLFLAIAAFVIQSEVVQLVQNSAKFGKPWFILYVGHSLYSLFIPALYIYERYFNRKPHEEAFVDIKRIAKTLPKFGLPPAEIDLFQRIIWLTLTFTFGALPWYVSVSRISLGEITAIYNCSGFFTYLLAMVFLDEKFLWCKLAAVIISIGGIFAIALGDSLHITVGPSAAIGYTSAILSSIGVSCYEVLYAKTVIPKIPSTKFALFISGALGLYSTVGGLVLFPILHYSGLEIFEWPSWTAFGYIVLNGFLGLSYNVLFILVITFSSPVYASIGILISIPVTSLVDMILIGTPFGLNMAIGTMCIFLGFILLQIDRFSHEPPNVWEEEERLIDT